MIILIAGASHTGKTVLAQKLLEKYKYYVIGAAVVLVVIIALVAGGRKTEGEAAFL